MSKVATHWILAMVLTVGACSAGPGASGGPSAATSDPVASIDLRSDEPPAKMDPATAEAQAFRVQFGLRSDLEWIELVAADPEAAPGREEFGVPLTPAERAELRNRHNPLDRSATELLSDIKAYGGLFPDSFAGAYEDQRVAIGFVVMFSRDIERHRSTLWSLFPAVVELDLRKVRWSVAELDAFRADVDRDVGWMGGGRARFLGAETSWFENVVRLRFLGGEREVDRIAAYYGSPPWLSVERVGPLPWLGPRGDLVIDVVLADGSPARDVECEAVADDPERQEGSAVRFSTNLAGTCAISRLPVGGYTVVFGRWVEGRFTELTRITVVVQTPTIKARVSLPVD